MDKCEGYTLFIANGGCPFSCVAANKILSETQIHNKYRVIPKTNIMIFILFISENMVKALILELEEDKDGYREKDRDC